MPPVTLWTVEQAGTVWECTMTPGCAGVDLEVHRDGILLRRERYADRGTAAERATALRQEVGENRRA